MEQEKIKQLSKEGFEYRGKFIEDYINQFEYQEEGISKIKEMLNNPDCLSLVNAFCEVMSKQ